MAELAKEVRAWEMLCARLGRDPKASEESDTCTLRAAWKAMLTFSEQEAASPTLLEALIQAVEEIEDLRKYANNHGAMIDNERCDYARAAITLATGKDA